MALFSKIGKAKSNTARGVYGKRGLPAYGSAPKERNPMMRPEVLITRFWSCF